MATLTVWKFDSVNGANDALVKLQSLQKQHLIEVSDAAIVEWPQYQPWNASAARLEVAFAAHIEPLLHAAPNPQSPELVAYRGVFHTVAAGDREYIYRGP